MSSRMKADTSRFWLTPACPASISTTSMASVAYATEDSASEESTASPVTFESRSDSSCRVSSGFPTNRRLMDRQSMGANYSEPRPNRTACGRRPGSPGAAHPGEGDPPDRGHDGRRHDAPAADGVDHEQLERREIQREGEAQGGEGDEQQAHAPAGEPAGLQCQQADAEHRRVADDPVQRHGVAEQLGVAAGLHPLAAARAAL